MKFCKIYFISNLNVYIFCIVSLVCISIVSTQRTQRVRSRLCSAVNVSNAVVRFRHNYKIMRVMCAPGFTLQGNSMVGCLMGKWNAAIPVCAKEGCKKLTNPLNGIIISTHFTATLYCKERYKTVGGKITYCNGTDWDRPLGSCREATTTTQMFCDFETDDLCGWSNEEFHNFDWKRIMAANMFQQIRTGPQHDHTTFTANAGHYMLLESFDQLPHSVARLISPIYSSNVTKNSCCFRFYYFMYGATVGNLNIYIKPVSIDMDIMLQNPKYLKFSINGNQKNIWKEGLFTISEMREDFQIIIEGTAGNNHLSDIAIDDVHLMEYAECNPDSTTASTNVMDYTDYAIYDVQSCEGRCGETNSSGYGIQNIDGKFYKLCDCHMECENLLTCCPNFRSICDFEKSTNVIETPTIIPTIKTSTSYDDVLLHIRRVSLSYVNATETIQTLLTSQIAMSTKPGYESAVKTTINTATTTADNFKLTENTMLIKGITVSMKTLVPDVLSTDFSHIMEMETTTRLPLSTQYIIENSSPEWTVNDKALGSKEIITWEIKHKSNINGKSVIWFIFTITFSMLSVLILLGISSKCFRKIKSIGLRCKDQRSWNDDYSEKATLTYSHNNDIILQN